MLTSTNSNLSEDGVVDSITADPRSLTSVEVVNVEGVSGLEMISSGLPYNSPPPVNSSQNSARLLKFSKSGY